MEYLKRLNWKTVAIAVFSIVVMGFSIAVLKFIDYGTDPYAFMNFSIAEKLGWSLGNWQLVMNILLFIPVLIWGRDQIGLGTVLMMVVLGYMIDASIWALELAGFPALMVNTALRVIWMVIGLAIFCFSAAVYMSAGMGTSPCDAVSVLLAHKFHKLPFRVVRFLYDAITVVIGVLFGGKLRLVTVLTVLFLGVTVEFVAKKFFKKKM